MKVVKIVPFILPLLLLSVAVAFVAPAEEVSAEKKTAVKKAIAAYIQRDQAIKGAFLIKDNNSNAVRDLKFDHVHDGVHPVEGGQYYACVDFKEGEKVLDLDFYLKPTSSGDLEVSNIVIHKIDGKKVGP